MLFYLSTCCDHGRGLVDESPIGSRSAIAPQPGYFNNGFIPSIEFTPKIAAKALSNNEDTSPLYPPYPRTEGSFSQSASLISSTFYGNFQILLLLSSSPFYALHCSFAFTIASESQVVNFLTARLRVETSRWICQPAAMNKALETLQRHKALGVTHRQQTRTALDVVRQQGLHT